MKEKSKKEVKAEPEPEDMISTVKSRRLMSMQAKKEKEEMDRQNKGWRATTERPKVGVAAVRKLNLFRFPPSLLQSAWRKKPRRSGYADRRLLQRERFRTASPKPNWSCAELPLVPTETTTGLNCGRSCRGCFLNHFIPGIES